MSIYYTDRLNILKQQLDWFDLYNKKVIQNPDEIGIYYNKVLDFFNHWRNLIDVLIKNYYYLLNDICKILMKFLEIYKDCTLPYKRFQDYIDMTNNFMSEFENLTENRHFKTLFHSDLLNRSEKNSLKFIINDIFYEVHKYTAFSYLKDETINDHIYKFEQALFHFDKSIDYKARIKKNKPRDNSIQYIKAFKSMINFQQQYYLYMTTEDVLYEDLMKSFNQSVEIIPQFSKYKEIFPNRYESFDSFLLEKNFILASRCLKEANYEECSSILSDLVNNYPNKHNNSWRHVQLNIRLLLVNILYFSQKGDKENTQLFIKEFEEVQLKYAIGNIGRLFYTISKLSSLTNIISSITLHEEILHYFPLFAYFEDSSSKSLDLKYLLPQKVYRYLEVAKLENTEWDIKKNIPLVLGCIDVVLNQALDFLQAEHFNESFTYTNNIETTIQNVVQLGSKSPLKDAITSSMVDITNYLNIITEEYEINEYFNIFNELVKSLEYLNSQTPVLIKIQLDLDFNNDFESKAEPDWMLGQKIEDKDRIQVKSQTEMSKGQYYINRKVRHYGSVYDVGNNNFLIKAQFKPNWEYWEQESIKYTSNNKTDLIQNSKSKDLKLKGEELIKRLKTCPKGKNTDENNIRGYIIFHDLCIEIFNFLFKDSFYNLKIKKEYSNPHSSDRMDFIFVNQSLKSYWKNLKKEYNAKLIITECKNYTDSPYMSAIDQLVRYMDDKKTTFGILLCRSYNDTIKKNVVKKYKEQNKYILVIDEKMLINMLEKKVASEDIENYLEQQENKILMN